MQSIFQEFAIWLVQFVCIAFGIMIAVHLIARKLRQINEDTDER